MLIVERRTGCLLSTRLGPGNSSTQRRIVLLLLLIVPRLQRAFRGVPIKLRCDAVFALPLACEFYWVTCPPF